MKCLHYFALALMLILGGVLCAGTIDYTFSATQGTYTPISGGVLLGTESSDDQRFVDPASPAGELQLLVPVFQSDSTLLSTMSYLTDWQLTIMVGSPLANHP